MNRLTCIITTLCLICVIVCVNGQTPTTSQKRVLIPFQDDDLELYGYKDSITGNVVIKPQYTSANSFHEGFAAVNIGGKIVFEEYEDYDEEDYFELFSDYEEIVVGGKYGYINSTGNLVIPTTYDEAYDFKNGMAIVGKKATGANEESEIQYGLINKKGETLIPLQYDGLSILNDKYFRAAKNDLRGIISNTGKLIIPLKYDFIKLVYGLFIVEKGDLCGLVDANNKLLIPVTNRSIFDDEYNFLEVVTDTKKTYYYHTSGIKYDTKRSTSNHGCIIVSKEGKYGLINKELTVLVPFIYDKISDYVGMTDFQVVKNGKTGTIAYTGKEVIPCIYDDIFAFKNGLAMAIKNNKRGYIDTLGVERIPVKYDKLYLFNEKEGIEETQLNGLYGLIDLNAKRVVTEPIYDYIGPFRDDRSLVISGAVYDTIASKFVGGKYGYIDRSGAVAIPLQYTAAGHFTNGKATVTLNGKEIAITPSGKEAQ